MECTENVNKNKETLSVYEEQISCKQKLPNVYMLLNSVYVFSSLKLLQITRSLLLKAGPFSAYSIACFSSVPSADLYCCFN